MKTCRLQFHLKYGLFLSGLAANALFLVVNLYGQQTVTYQASTDRIANPERGFYHYIETRASQPVDYSLTELRSFRENEDITLLYCINYLDTFIDTPINSSFLSHFEANMNTVREAGLKCIVRFAYTDDDPTTRNEAPPFGDASKEQILSHIEQLGPLLTKHADVIAVLQAGFIGVWGEWYYTDHFVDNPAVPWDISAAQQANRLEIIQALLAHLPETHQVAVRYPHAKQGMLQRETPLLAEEAYTSTALARIGFHNDCFLAGEQDFGTYRDDDDRLFLAAETNYVALGGESCQNNPPRSSCENALQELERFHWTYLNIDYQPQVLASWQSGGCMEEIEKKLGYRLVLKNGTYPLAIETGQPFNLQFEIENTGWAAPVKNRPLSLIAVHTASGEKYTATLPAQLQSWEAGANANLDYEVCAAAGIPAGEYALALFLPDTTITDQHQANYAIRFANESNLWDDVHGFNMLNHTVRLEQGTENCTGPIILASDELATSIETNTLEDIGFNWTLYPNPASNSINITFNQEAYPDQEAKIEVFDLLGRLITSKNISISARGISTMDLATTELLPGVYAIRVTILAQHSTKLITIDR
ncbi:MAG: DUF4832 domain-containing protein [Rhodothermales bacterium]